jgi:hypothetical protein
LGPPSRLASRLHGRQQQRDQNPDNGDHDQQFDERKARPAVNSRHEQTSGKKEIKKLTRKGNQ